MPSRKGKGRQSRGFTTKSQRAQFHHEWQTRLLEDYYEPRQQQQHPQRPTNHNNSAVGSTKIQFCPRPPQVQNSLRRLIAERQFWDRIQDQQQQQPKRLAPTPSAHVPVKTSPPGWLLYHSTNAEELDPFGAEYEVSPGGKPPTLQALALQALARALPQYLDEWGWQDLHNGLSILPGPALAALSVRASESGILTNRLCRALGRHSQVVRFSVGGKYCEEETDPNWKDWEPNLALRETFLDFPDQSSSSSPLSVPAANPLEPLWISPTAVPDSWEDLIVSDDDDDDDEDDRNNHPPPPLPQRLATGGFLERLELGNLPLLQVEVLREILLAHRSTLTHLGLSGSLRYYDRGPDVLWQLAEWAPQLQVLDVSGNASWVTEPLLRSVYESYRAMWESKQDTVSSSGNTPTSRAVAAATTLQNENEGQDESWDTGSTILASVPTCSTTSGIVQSSQPPTRPPLLLIKASGCLPRSGQILMEMEFGTLF